eukprot:3651452-Pyramimonas_sp.AAC.1
MAALPDTRAHKARFVGAYTPLSPRPVITRDSGLIRIKLPPGDAALPPGYVGGLGANGQWPSHW